MATPHTIHDRMISRLQRDYPQSQTQGFRRAIQKLKWDWENWDDAEPVEVGQKKPSWEDFLDWGEAWKDGIIPDLWFIDEECMSVVCIEVEDTSRINTRKLDRYVRLWWHLDDVLGNSSLVLRSMGNSKPRTLDRFYINGVSAN
jgi:hypothetical protein